MTVHFACAAFCALLAAPLVLGIPLTARADGTIQVTDAFTRSAPAGAVGGLFLTIVNTGSADRLTGAVSPVAAKAELHESIDDKGVMKMRPVAGLAIPAGATVKLAPGGYHVMLIGLKQTLTVGDHTQITLTFEKAGEVSVEASVVRPGAGGPAGHGMDHDMSKMPNMGNMPRMAPAK
jgi:periplasmic copper chaperone A